MKQRLLSSEKFPCNFTSNTYLKLIGVCLLQKKMQRVVFTLVSRLSFALPVHLPNILSWHFLCTAQLHTAIRS